MQKTILVTGATDGIGLETARMLVYKGHNVLVHGRNRSKLDQVAGELSRLKGEGQIQSYMADLSRMKEVDKLAVEVAESNRQIDILINNAGVYVTSEPITAEGLDVRFAVNTIAPYLLTRKLLPLMDSAGRVVNVSSAAQAPVDPDVLQGLSLPGDDGSAYAQSKLGITMWSYHLARVLGYTGPAVIAVNPKSFLGSKMVKQAYGTDGHDVRIGADILVQVALADEFSMASGKYFDNDIGRFSDPHPNARNPEKCQEIVDIMDGLLERLLK